MAAPKERVKRKTMRIVSGASKGRKINVPKGRDVRPTTDRVREALFSSIGEKIRDAHVLDLFAGTGALGLESLSRGAHSVTFVEKNRVTYKVLTQNIKDLGYLNNIRMMSRDALSALKGLAKEGAGFDVVFLDPPYRGPLLVESLKLLSSLPLLHEDALIIAEHPADTDLLKIEGFQIVSNKRYGKTILSFVQRAI